MQEALNNLNVDLPLETVAGMMDLVDRDRDGYLSL